jgi:3-oxoacyl-[acyl-carrier protein] reductase
MRLKDKVALITGAGQGIGRATALTFAREGAIVAVADINMTAATAVADEITHADGRAKPLFLDVLVNNAGIVRDARMQKMTEEQFDAVIAVNLKGVWLCAKAVAPLMSANGGGSIINAASVVGLYGNFGQTNYVAAKSGVIGMTKTWARELGPSGVRVNAIAPGFVATEMISSVPEKVLDSVQDKTPLRRLGRPEDIANAYLFLASDESSFITGHVLSVDGGLIV